MTNEEIWLYKNSGGGGNTSEMSISTPNLDKKTPIIFEEDPRFEITNLNGWQRKDLFKFNEQNMYSSPQIGDNQSSALTIKNVSPSAIFMRIAYDSSSEGNGYDYGQIIINDVDIAGQIGGTAKGVTDVVALSSDAVLTFTYRKDGGSAVGLDNVGMLAFEIGA